MLPDQLKKTFLLESTVSYSRTHPRELHDLKGLEPGIIRDITTTHGDFATSCLNSNATKSMVSEGLPDWRYWYNNKEDWRMITTTLAQENSRLPYSCVTIMTSEISNQINLAISL